jgi:AcrR family transcriptional regulator
VESVEARLISIAREAFFKDGYGATTMDKVAATYGGSKTTLYSRFPTKEALFRAIVQDQIQSWDTGANATPIEIGDSLEDSLRSYGDVWLRAGISSDYVNMSRLLFSESGRFPELAESARSSSTLGAASIAKLIRHFAEKDGVACRDPEAAAQAFQQIIAGWIYSAILANSALTLEEGRAWLDYALGIFIAGRAAW